MSSLSEQALPLYQRVHDAVMARIVSGDLAPGAMLPSEFDLAAQYSVSQGTARKALSKLEQSGLVERHQGKGTFVATTLRKHHCFIFSVCGIKMDHRQSPSRFLKRLEDGRQTPKRHKFWGWKPAAQCLKLLE